MNTSTDPQIPAPAIYPSTSIWALRRIGRDPIRFLEALAEAGDVVPFSIGGQRTFLLKHPDHIASVLVTHHERFVKGPAFQRAQRLLGTGLLTAEGELHRQRRRVVQPAFHRVRMDGYSETMVACAARLRERWLDGQTVDVAAEMQGLTLAVVSRTLFGVDTDAAASDVRNAVGLATASVDPLFSLVAPPRRVLRARDRLRAIVNGLLDRRVRSADHSEDLLSLLLQADAGARSEQTRDDALTVFLAGHDTIANALTWTWTLLAEHPEAEARLHRELATVIADHLPTTDDLIALKYTRSVLAESLRLRPPAWVIARHAIRPHQIGTTLIPTGSLVLMSPYLVHRDARFFPAPLAFDPDRWLGSGDVSRPKLAYLPFGAGPRSCIGEGFAWLEGVILLATLAQRWRLRAVTAGPVEIDARITLRPRGAVRMVTHGHTG